MLDDCPIIAHKNNSLTVLDIFSVSTKDTIDVPLSAFLSDFAIIRLDNSDEALVGGVSVFAISKNYIGLFDYKLKNYKLFKKNGEFVRLISSAGQGPNDFLIGLYDSYLDEENNKIYLLSYRATKLLVFDFEGNAQQHIPLPFIVHKGRFRIDPNKKELIMTALPFSDTPFVIWKQDFDGNILQGIEAGHFVIEPGDYSNEVNQSQNTAFFDFSLFYWGPRADSLYHYHEEENVLESKFTVDWKNKAIIMHDYLELPNHFLVNLFLQTSSPDGTIARNPLIIMNKQNLRGGFVRIKLDMLGEDISPSWLHFNRGYFITDMYAYELKEQLESALSKSETLTPEMKETLIQLNDSLAEDDNNVLFIGKLKSFIQ